MEGIKVTLAPNQERDYQAFSFDELGITYSEWTEMSEDDKKTMVLESIMDNIFSCVDSIEEY